jgi:UDP:flavonoid glycosyltransferase YjiC (YdhE family)
MNHDRDVSTVLLAALEGSGAAANLEPLIRLLQERGHRVHVLTDPAARHRIEALGARFVPVDDPALPSMGQRSASPLARVRRLRPNIRAAFLDPIPAQWAAVQRVLTANRIDVVLTDLMFFGAGILAAVPVDERPPLIALGLVPPPAPDLDVAPYGTGLQPRPGVFGRLRNLLLARFVAGPILGVIDSEFQQLVRSHTGYDARSPWQLAAGADVWAQATVPRFEYPRAQPPANLRLVGPLAPIAVTAAPDWWEDDPAVVVVHADGRLPLQHVVVPAIEALQDAGSITVVSGATREDTERAFGRALPANVRFEPVVPWSWLMPARTTFVSTGDYVQVQHALRHGVPVVVSGASEPQVETKARVTWSGVGVDVPEARPTSAELADAIARARADPRIQLAVAKIAVQMGRTTAELTICEMVEELAGGARMAAPPAWVQPARSARAL